jgi:hypothetical protein
MSLEPEVMVSIQRHKRRIAMLKLFVSSVALVVIASATALTAFIIISSKTSSIRGEAAKDFAFRDLEPLLFGFLCMGLFFIFNMLSRLLRGRLESHFIDHRLNNNQRALAQKFLRGLSGASIATGTPHPKLVFVDIQGVSSLPLASGDDKPTIALTIQALEAGFSSQEAEVLMAHDLSLILIGDVVQPKSTQNKLEYFLIY